MVSMKFTLADYETKEGMYLDEEGACHESSELLIQCGLLGFCACGSPGENLEYVLGGLELINEIQDRDAPADLSERRKFYEEINARSLAHHGNLNAERFFYYVADSEGWTEHGSVVPGWLTDYGLHLLALLREWNASES